jgi:hypothetical protein
MPGRPGTGKSNNNNRSHKPQNKTAMSTISAFRLIKYLITQITGNYVWILNDSNLCEYMQLQAHCEAYYYRIIMIQFVKY